MKKALLIFIAILALSGCNAIDDMKGMFEKQELVQTAIKDEYGWDSQVGWNINNGILTQVTIILKADQVRDEKVSTLEKAAVEAITRSFKSKPRAIYIQVMADIDN